MRVYRSPLRLFVFGIVGLLLMLAAADVMFGHWISTPPDGAPGLLTTRGQAQQRGDFIWGGAMIGVGALLFGASVVELIRRNPVIEVHENGIVAAIGATHRDVVLQWAQIEEVASGVRTDLYDGSTRDRLLVRLREKGDLPRDVIGATWEGRSLSIDAHDWTTPVTEVVLAAQGGLEYYRRVEAIGQMGEPSLVWEMKMSTGGPASDDDTGMEGTEREAE